MEDITKYTKKALDEKHKNSFLVKYKCDKLSIGITHICYDLTTNIAGYMLLFPIALSADVIRLGVTGPRFNHYFDTESGEQLGISQTEAANCANTKGRIFLSQKQFDKAKEWFDKAYQLCPEADPNKGQYKDSRDLAGGQERQQKREQQEREQREQREQELREQQEREQREQREREQREREEREQREREQRELYKEGEKLWNKAWEAESDTASDRSTEAETKFNQAKGKFDEANKLTTGLDNLECSKWSQICSLKIEGNALFNEGFALLQLSNASKEQTTEAYEKLKKAEEKFEQALNISNDQRFKDCVEIAEKNKNKVHPAKLNSSLLAASLAKLTLTPTFSAVPEGNFDSYNYDKFANFNLTK